MTVLPRHGGPSPSSAYIAGHVHQHGIATTAESYDLGRRSAILVQAGTATSTRRRGATNSFNLIRIDRSDIAIERFDWSLPRNTFEIEATYRFARRDGAWTQATVATD